MKKITLFILFCFVCGIGNAQTYEWAKRIAGTGAFSVNTSEIIASLNGDVYVSGKFTGTVDFDPSTTTENKTAQGIDGFVAAFNPAGGLEWVYTTNVAGNEEIPGMSFYTPVVNGYHLTAVVKLGSNSFRLERLNRKTGSTMASSSVYSSSSAIDIKKINDEGYIVGGFGGSFNLGSSVLNLTSAGQSDGFCIKIGGTLTTYTIIATNSYGGTGFDIINNLSGPWLCGSFTGTINLGSLNYTSSGGKDGLFFRISLSTLEKVSGSDAIEGFVKGTGDAEINSIYFGQSSGQNFIVGIGGYFSGTNTNFVSGFDSFQLTSGGGNDGFVASYLYDSTPAPGLDSWTSYWGFRVGNTSNDEQVIDLAMLHTSSSRMYHVGNSIPQSGGSNVLLGSHNVAVAGGPTSYIGNFTPSVATTVTTASAVDFTVSNIYYTGDFNGTTDFNIDPAVTNNLTFVSGGTNGYIQKSSFCTVSAAAPLIKGVNTTSCSNSSVNLYISDTSNIGSNLNWKWYSGSCTGTLVGTGSNITVSPSVTTTYYARGEDGCVADGACSAGFTITVTPPSSAVSLLGNTLTATQSGAFYQWINCTNNTNIAGQTSQSYTPTVSGDYKVNINVNGCSVTSTCTTVNV